MICDLNYAGWIAPAGFFGRDPVCAAPLGLKPPNLIPGVPEIRVAARLPVPPKTGPVGTRDGQSGRVPPVQEARRTPSGYGRGVPPGRSVSGPPPPPRRRRHRPGFPDAVRPAGRRRLYRPALQNGAWPQVRVRNRGRAPHPPVSSPDCKTARRPDRIGGGGRGKGRIRHRSGRPRPDSCSSLKMCTGVRPVTQSALNSSLHLWYARIMSIETLGFLSAMMFLKSAMVMFLGCCGSSPSTGSW